MKHRNGRTKLAPANTQLTPTPQPHHSHMELRFEVDTNTYVGSLLEGNLTESHVREQLSMQQDMSLSHSYADSCVIG